jgi:CBS domain-containing protein
MRCDEVMTREVETVLPTASILEGARRMRDLDVGFLPVCEANGAPVGTLTDRDIVVRAVAEQTSYQSPVEDVMTADVVACRPEDDLERAEELMRANQVSRVLVLDDDGRIAGVISLADIARYELEREAGHTLADVKQQSEAPVS